MNGLDNVDKNHVQGQHLLADLFGIEDARLNDPVFFANLLKEMASAVSLTFLNEPQINAVDKQVTNGFLPLKDGHISCHWQSGFLAIDIMIFGEPTQEKNPDRAFAVVTETLSSQMIRKTTITRGFQS
jgi:S-adenosylmethionine decarboxylase